MSTVATANLVGVTGIARRLVMDGALEEHVAREAMRAASAERKPIAVYLTEKRLVTSRAMAASVKVPSSRIATRQRSCRSSTSMTPASLTQHP